MALPKARAARVDVQPDRAPATKKRGLRKIWRQVAQHAKHAKLVGFASLTLLFTGCTTMRGHEPLMPQPQPITNTLEPPRVVANDTVPYAISDARLDSIKQKFSETQSGRDMLSFAKKHKVKIEMSDSKRMDDDPNDGLFIQGLNRWTVIQLNSEIASDDMLMLTLAHEIRHSWHKREIKAGDLKLDPKRAWINDRVQEADCFAFEVHFGYEYEKATGKTLDPATREGGYGALATYYTVLRDSGMETQKAYELLLEMAFIHTHNLDYDSNFLERQVKKWQGVVDRPSSGILYEKIWDHPETDAEFAAAMRRMTTIGMDTTRDVSALKNWKDADFVDLNKTGGSAARDLAELAKAEAAFKAGEALWRDHWRSVMERIRVESAMPEKIVPTADLLKPLPKPPGISP